LTDRESEEIDDIDNDRFGIGVQNPDCGVDCEPRLNQDETLLVLLLLLLPLNCGECKSEEVSDSTDVERGDSGIVCVINMSVVSS
jgi:hypothetical protein